MAINYLVLGYFIKIFTGLDDLAITIPLVSGLGFDKTKSGKWAFGVGIFLAGMVAMSIAFFFSTIISGFKYANEMTAILLFILATAIYFELFDRHTEDKVKKSAKEVKEEVEGKLLKIFTVSFVAFLISSADDMIAYLPLFLSGFTPTLFAMAGIVLAIITEILVAIYFAGKIEKLNDNKEITSLVLVLLGIFVLSGMF